MVEEEEEAKLLKNQKNLLKKALKEEDEEDQLKDLKMVVTKEMLIMVFLTFRFFCHQSYFPQLFERDPHGRSSLSMLLSLVPLHTC